MKIRKTGIDFEIIWRKLNASITLQEEERLMSWLDENPRHAKFYREVKRSYTEGPSPQADPGRTRKAWNHVISEINARRRRKRIRRTTAAAALLVAAGITLLVVVPLLRHGEQAEPAYSVMDRRIKPGSRQAVLILDDGSRYDLATGTNFELEEGGARISSTGDAIEYNEKPSSDIELKYNSLSIPRGGEFYLTLSDGTRVWLNSETVLKYPVMFPEDMRTVELEGEAFFEVKRQEGCLFRVISGEQELEVLGTSFNLSSYPDENAVYTTLVEGKARVFLRKNPDVEKILKPLEQSRFVRGTIAISLEKVDVTEYVAWKEGIFSFRDRDLSEMMKTVSRWYDLEVIFENPEAERIKFTGDIRRYENFERILALIEKTNEVKFEVEGQTVIVR